MQVSCASGHLSFVDRIMYRESWTRKIFVFLQLFLPMVVSPYLPLQGVLKRQLILSSKKIQMSFGIGFFQIGYFVEVKKKQALFHNYYSTQIFPIENNAIKYQKLLLRHYMYFVELKKKLHNLFYGFITILFEAEFSGYRKENPSPTVSSWNCTQP